MEKEKRGDEIENEKRETANHNIGGRLKLIMM